MSCHEDALIARERRQIDPLTKNRQKRRDWRAVKPAKTHRKGAALKAKGTDPESATRKTRHGVVQGYTGIAAVDAKTQVVVPAEAFGTGQETGLPPQIAQAAREPFAALGEDEPLGAAAVLTDSGSPSDATLQQLHDQGIDALVADTGCSAREPRFAEAYQHKPKDKRRPPGERRSQWFQPHDFDSHRGQQTCRCPHGKMLKRSAANAVIKGRRGVSVAGAKAVCGTCPLRGPCLRKPGLSAYRPVTCFNGTQTHDPHPHTTAMKAKIDSRVGRLLDGRRLGIVAPVFGDLHNHRLRRFTRRARRKVDTQWTL